MMDALESVKKHLASIGFFRDFTAAEMSHVYHNGFFKICQPGEYLIHEGGVDRTLFVLITGMVEVTRSGTSSLQRVLATLGAGSIFGEIAFVARQVRSTNVIAREESLVFQLEEKHFSGLPAEMKVKIQQQAVKLLMDRLEAVKKVTGYEGPVGQGEFSPP
ncbi:MAG: cyclic nucleotide-binding domain-containing protein [Magnetococcales bacterium]|nr:cyclic nucleotide-binding domain-containing protein [Magnetococcales bacterium]